MSLNLRWVDESEYDRVGEARMYCYGAAAGDRERFCDSVTLGKQFTGDALLAERGGRAVGTATSLRLRMWVRGGAVPCQGVAWVGTVKTARRGGSASSNDQGVATRIMHETLRLAREQGQGVSALMPYRGWSYDDLRNGISERRHAWTAPIAVFPKG